MTKNDEYISMIRFDQDVKAGFRLIDEKKKIMNTLFNKNYFGGTILMELIKFLMHI